MTEYIEREAAQRKLREAIFVNPLDLSIASTRRRKDMSDKPKREITLGEMQDECKRALGCCIDGGCRVRAVCPTYLHLAPDALDLTDPPRFTEAQRAFLRAWYEIGATQVAWNKSKLIYDITEDSSGQLVQVLGTLTMLTGGEIGLKTGETLALAEMFGKDAT